MPIPNGQQGKRGERHRRRRRSTEKQVVGYWRKGAEIRGPAAALMMAASGRTALLDNLDGPGLPLLRQRLRSALPPSPPPVMREEYGAIEYGGLPVNRATFPNCLCDNSFRDATYDEVYSAISNTVHINGFRCRRACSGSSLMFHRVNRTSRYPRGWFGVVGQAPLPRRGIREGDPFCGPPTKPIWHWPHCRSGRASVRSRL
jgi:hypothetical protein